MAKMCGRYTITVTMEELMRRFLIEGSFPAFHLPRYNAAPGQMIPAIIHDGKRNRAGELRWGLVPEWAKDDKTGYKMINARAETVMQKPAFKTPFLRKRCLIPADGFYEWQQAGDGSKQPMRITMKDGSLFALAGLYDSWVSPDGRKISTCTILTTKPNSLMASIHNRMPVILRPEQEAEWLDRTNRNVKQLEWMLEPYPAEEMKAYPVSARVGQVKHDDPELILPVG